MPRVIAVATQKGGVGKTTTATNLAAAIVGQYALRALVLDLDPQCDATALLLGHTAQAPATIRDVLWEPRAAGEVMVPSPLHPDLFVVPGSGELAHDEKHVGPAQWDEIAQDARQTLIGGVPDDVDVVLIDTPPSLGLWLHCALAAADGYILLGEAGVLSARGMGAFLDTADQVAQNINPDLQRLGVVINNVRPTAEDEGFVGMYRQRFPGEILAVIPQRIGVKEAARFATPVEFFSAAPPDARRSYREIAAAVLERLGVPRRARIAPGAPPSPRARGNGAPASPTKVDRGTGPSAPETSPAAEPARVTRGAPGGGTGKGTGRRGAASAASAAGSTGAPGVADTATGERPLRTKPSARSRAGQPGAVSRAVGTPRATRARSTGTDGDAAPTTSDPTSGLTTHATAEVPADE